MAELHLNLLLIEDNPADAKLIQKALANSGDFRFKIEWVRELSDALDRLSKKGIGVVLLDLFLPDSRGIETFDSLSQAASDVPILVLTGLDDESIARQVLHRGAQDYLLKNHIDSYWLPRAIRHVIDRKGVEEAMFRETERAQVMLNSIGDGVLSTDISGSVTYLNRAAEKITAWSREEGLGRPLAEMFQVFDVATGERIPNPLELAVQPNNDVRLMNNYNLIRRDGIEVGIEASAAPIHDREGHVTGAVTVFRDVSATRAMALRMSYLAHYDFLTDLPNRVLLSDRINQAIALAGRHRKRIAILFLDLDHFKRINDSLGHAVGDKLLQAVAQRLVDCVRSSDTISRQGGDEFVVLLPEIDHPEYAVLISEKLQATITAPYCIDQHELHVTGSIGISIYPDDGQDAGTLMKSADTAMYHAKDDGRNNYRFFTQDMHVRAIERQFLEGSLRRALQRQEFILHYQPKVDLVTGTITGAEALLRWMHPDRGNIPPELFVSVAEECGLILPIGRWVLREACRQARAWQDAGLNPIPMAVNISAIEFRSKDFLESLRNVLEDTRLEPRYLELELTEGVLMEDVESTASVLRALKSMGVTLAVDDFGTGYSSLSYLRRFPIDALKIDQSFVREITANAEDATIVSAVISMGKALKHRVIAEGVETLDQLAFLQDQFCSEGQGYYFSLPLVGEQFAKLLQSGESNPEASYSKSLPTVRD